MSKPDNTAARHLDLIRHACFRMAELMATDTSTDITTTATRAEAAVRQALAEGVDIITLSAALDASPKLIHLIAQDDFPLVTLHPTHPC